MAYRANNVFPLREVYNFADMIGGEFANIVCDIKQWRSFPPGLRSYGMFSQVRRVLCYLALQRFGHWNQFVSQCWPTANNRDGQNIIKEFEDDFINNGKLAQYISGLPPSVHILVP